MRENREKEREKNVAGNDVTYFYHAELQFIFTQGAVHWRFKLEVFHHISLDAMILLYFLYQNIFL